MKNLRYIFIPIIIFSLLCCAFFVINYAFEFQRFRNSDPFYNIYDEGFFGRLRFPLIKPYEVKKGLEQNGWLFELQVIPTDPDSNIFGYSQLQLIEKVTVENNVIMVYTPDIDEYTIARGKKAIHWFVIIPHKKIKIGFETEDDFLAYVKDYGIDKPSWMNTKSAFDQFRRTGCLNWIPECNQQ